MAEPSRSWSGELSRSTKQALDNWACLQPSEHLAFKHIAFGFGVIALDDLMRGMLRTIERGTGREIILVNTDDLIGAGWALD